MKQKSNRFRKVLFLNFAVAFVLNLAWEMLQMPAYSRFAPSTIEAWLICALAAIGDALYTLLLYILLYWLGKRLTQKVNLFISLDLVNILAIALLGAIAATIVERIALTFGFWQYSQRMVEVPLFQVGILPLLQLIILPLFTFWITGHITKSQIMSKG